MVVPSKDARVAKNREKVKADDFVRIVYDVYLRIVPEKDYMFDYGGYKPASASGNETRVKGDSLRGSYYVSFTMLDKDTDFTTRFKPAEYKITLDYDNRLGKVSVDNDHPHANDTVAVTNEAITKVLGKMDVSFSKKLKVDRHVITTQAITGAVAKTSSGAGSLAIAVANLTTKAEIANSADGMKITGVMQVEATELRRTRTHATAVDAKGEDDNNEGAKK